LSKFKELCKNPEAGFSVGLVDDNDLYKWSVCFTGPEDTIYEVKNFFLILRIIIQLYKRILR